PPVTRAPSRAERASKGHVITSLETVDLLDALFKMQCRRLYSIPVKGKEKEVDICELLWTDHDEATKMVEHRTEARPQATLRTRVYGERTVVIPHDRKSSWR